MKRISKDNPTFKRVILYKILWAEYYEGSCKPVSYTHLDVYKRQGTSTTLHTYTVFASKAFKMQNFNG